MPGIQRAGAGKFAAKDIERGEPGTGMTVGSVGMRAMEGQVARERDGGALVRGQDDVAVGVTFCRAYLADGEAQLVELNLGAVGQQRVRVVGLGRPLRAVDGRPLDRKSVV